MTQSSTEGTSCWTIEGRSKSEAILHYALNYIPKPITASGKAAGTAVIYQTDAQAWEERWLRLRRSR